MIVLGEAEPDTLRPIGGSRSDRFNNALIDSMAKTGWFFSNQSDEDRARQLFVAVTGLQAFKADRRDRGHAGRPGDGGAPRVDGMQPPGDGSRSAV